MLTIQDPTSRSRQRVAPSFIKDHWNEWKRIQAGGIVPEDDEEDEGGVQMDTGGLPEQVEG